MRAFIPRPKTKGKKQATAQEAMTDLLSKMGFDPDKYALFEIWDRETQGLIKGCKAVAVQGKRLYIQVPSVVHRQELMYSRERLIKRLNQAMGRKVINEIRFELSPDKGETLRGENPTGKWNRSLGKRYE